MTFYDSTGPHIIAKLGSLANIWGIGATLLWLMNRVLRPYALTYLEPDDAEPKFNADATEFYSETLRGLLMRCVAYLPSDRITPSELLEQIRALTDSSGKSHEQEDFARGMRTRALTAEEPQLVWTSKVVEKYRLGFTLQNSEAISIRETAAQNPKKPDNKKNKKKE